MKRGKTSKATRNLHWRVVLPAALALVCGPTLAQTSANAQPDVTLFGLVDGGLTWVSNVGGTSSTLVDTGAMQSNRWGLRGSESLGQGWQAQFQLENGFNLHTGTARQSGRLFGRQAWVGLTSDTYGSIRFGRQYEFFVDTMQEYITARWSAGGYAHNPLNNDRMAGARSDNAVKYTSPVMSGLRLGALYAFAGSPGSVGNRTRSLGANFASGNFSTGVAWTEVDRATLNIAPLIGSSTSQLIGGRKLREWAIGARYKLPSFTLHGLYSQAMYLAHAAANQTFRNIQAGVAHAWRPDISVGAAYGLTLRGSHKHHQLSLTVDHFLSKRTDVYAQTVFQHATGSGATAAINNWGSSSANQSVLRAGMRHKF